MRSPGNAWQIASIVLVILAVALQWYSHWNRLLLTPDSCDYISASVSFKTSYIFLSPDGSRYDQWPPLFPIILSIFDNPADVFYWVQLVLVAWIGVLAVIGTRKIIEDPLLQLICQASILLGVHLLLIGVFLWSELLFLLMLFYFIQFVERSQHSRRAFAAAIIVGFLMCLQRNAGLFFVGAAVLWYGKDVRRSIPLLLLSTSGFWAWNIYNAKLGQEYIVWTIYNFRVMSNAMVHALAPIGFLSSVIFIEILGGMGWLLRSDFIQKPGVRLLCISIVVYLAGLAVLFKLHGYDDDRYAAIVLPFFMILAFRAFEIIASKQTSAVRIMLMILVVCWMAYPLSRTIKNALQWHEVSFTSTCNN